MKLYPSISVETTFQNFGSWWLLILDGPEEEIELTYNGLYNFGATNVPRYPDFGRTREGLEYTDGTRTKAIMWTTPENMFKFFFASHFIACQQENGRANSIVVANQRLEEFKKHTAPFLDYGMQRTFVDTFDVGVKTAEKPDYNYKEAATLSANKQSSEVTLDKP